MKNLYKILLGLFLVIFAISCSKDEGTELVIAEQDVVFDITNVVQQVAGKSAMLAGKDGANDPLVPECSDLVPTTVQLVLDGPNQSAENIYTIPLVTLNGKTETEVMKLAPGDYKLTSFVVFSGTTAMWASPAEGSYYDLLWKNFNFLNVPFKVSAFNKIKVPVDVLCYKPSSYQQFGFAWFAYAKIEVHTICFFGDICTKYFKEFHAQSENNPYASQTYDGYDFPALFDIVVKKDVAGGVPVIVNDLTKNNNLSWKGIGAPLCVEYPDMVGVDETFTFEIFLYMPDGTKHSVYTGNFNDTARSVAGNANGFGGADGIFDFVVGNCSFNGNANVELPAYLPIPTSGIMTLSDGPFNNSTNTYVKATFSSMVAPTLDIFNGAVLGAWCATKIDAIYLNVAYPVVFYSSLVKPTIPALYQYIEWGSLNWIMNNLGSYTPQQIQEAIWEITTPGNTTFGAFATAALTHKTFVPIVGDYAIVLIDAVEAPEQVRLQLMIVRIDP